MKIRITTKVFVLALVSISISNITDSYCQLTHEQTYFDWTDLPFDKNEYNQRRINMIARLSSPEHAIYLCPSRDGISNGETFKQLDDFNYFTGLEFPNSVLVFDSENNAAILFAPGRDFRFESGSRQNDFPGRPLGNDPEMQDKTGITDIRPFDELENFISKKVAEGKIFKVNIGRPGSLPKYESALISSWSTEQALTYHLQQTYHDMILANAFADVGALRVIKSPQEVEALKAAVKITIKGISAAVKHIRPGVDERMLEAEMEAEFKRLGSPRIGFASIIKSGPNSLWPWRILASHYERRNRKMEAGELVIFDVGCEYKGYVSDMGRTFPVSGKFTDEQKSILKMEIAVADAIIAAIKPGVTFAELRKVADDNIPEKEKKYMQVGLFFGHHLGLSTGDPFDANGKLAPGMVFTVEPWYYNHEKNISVFTEDEILVTETGSEVLTKDLPRSAEELENLMKK